MSRSFPADDAWAGAGPKPMGSRTGWRTRCDMPPPSTPSFLQLSRSSSSKRAERKQCRSPWAGVDPERNHGSTDNAPGPYFPLSLLRALGISSGDFPRRPANQLPGATSRRAGETADETMAVGGGRAHALRRTALMKQKERWTTAKVRSMRPSNLLMNVWTSQWKMVGQPAGGS